MKIDKIFIINLKHRTDRRDDVIKELTKAKLDNYEMFDAVQPKTIEEINNWNPKFVSEKPDWLRSDFLKFRLGSLGCLLSHVEIMKTSLERGYEQVLILEDDAEFRLGKYDSFNEVLESLESQTRNIKFDMFYFGGTHEQDKLWQISENIFQTKGTGTTGAYLINSRGMKLILKLIKGYNDAIDVFYKKSAQQILKCYTTIPALIIQKDSYSDIVQTNVKYNFDRLYNFCPPKPQMKEITMVLTSCNRPNELQITLESFFKFNTYQIKKIIIIDDSGKLGCIDECLYLIPSNVEKNIIYNKENIGQISSIDKAYSLVDTEYIFHCEDDWEFYDYGFIEKSMEILSTNEKIYTIWLREYQNFKVVQNGQPVNPNIVNNTHRILSVFKERTNTWSGFTFNPGLRRLKDCKLLMPYSQYVGSNECNCGGVEQALSNLYYKKGFVSAITLNEKGFIRHIGWDNPTIREY